MRARRPNDRKVRDLFSQPNTFRHDLGVPKSLEYKVSPTYVLVPTLDLLFTLRRENHLPILSRTATHLNEPTATRNDIGALSLCVLASGSAHTCRNGQRSSG